MAVSASAAPFPPQDPSPQQQSRSHPCQAREGRGQGHVAACQLQSAPALLRAHCQSVSHHGSALLHLHYCFSLFLSHSPLLISPLHIILPPISHKKCMSLISLRCPLCVTSKFLIRHSASCVSQCCSRADLPWHSQQLLCLDTFFQVEAHTHTGWAGVLVVGVFFIIVYETSAVYKLFLLNVIIFSVA